MVRAEQVRRRGGVAAFVPGLVGLMLQACTCSSPSPPRDNGDDRSGGTRDTATAAYPTATTGDTAQVPLAWVSIDVGYVDSCGVLNDGRLICWGYDEWVAMSPTSGGPFVAVSRGIGVGGCALTTAGTVSCWCERTEAPVCAQQPADAGYVEVQYATYWACAAKDTGVLHCWGDVPRGAPAEAVLDWSIELGDGCAVFSDGSVSCWGNPSGDADGPPPEFKYVQVAVGRTHGCALDTEGDVHCWGTNGYLEPYPAAPPGPFASITAWNQITCGIRPDATAECWYDFPQLNDVNWGPPPGVRWAQIGLGEWDGCGITVDGDAHCWTESTDSEGEVGELPALSEL